ncbi:hypothetical protein [Pseudonocardia sp. NPDC049635]|uniref:hypothetical protein n=1 Tax=Pseudonocardia sp. NPDC049635 TaxID=3155506 RepID=UPI0033F5AC86
MTATGYRRRQRRKGYPRQLLPAMLPWQARVLRAHGIPVGRLRARDIVDAPIISYRGRGG